MSTPSSRASQNETFFPVQSHNRTPSGVFSERMGAFIEMSHTEARRSSTPSTNKLRVDMNSSNSTHNPNTETPILPSSSVASHQPSNPFSRGSQHLSSTQSHPLRVNLNSNQSSFSSQRPLLPPQNNINYKNNHQKAPVRFEPPHQNIPPPAPRITSDAIYQPTTLANSQAGSSDSRRRHDRLAEVYSQSGDTAEFARNLSDYINDRIPYQVSISILSCFSLLAFLLIIFGVLNLPFCTIQPMIPIWLIIEGCLFIISATFRIYFLIPTPQRSRYRRKQRKIGGSLLCKGLEILFLLTNIVWLILGCVWTYGSRSYVHFNEGMFEQHYCDPTVYWSAFIACTAFLIFYCTIIIVLICLLVVGSCKEIDNQDQELD